MVEKYPDSTLSEYCEYWLMNYNEAVSPSRMCRELHKQNLTRKKKTIRSIQFAAERVQIYMCESWEKVKIIDPNNLVFLEENDRTYRAIKPGIFGGNRDFALARARTHARSQAGTRVSSLKPFY
jgi:hypothetical protein